MDSYILVILKPMEYYKEREAKFSKVDTEGRE